jgi:methylthioribose-1-phosphate isomerase
VRRRSAVAGAIGLVATMLPHAGGDAAAFRARLGEHAARIRAARPTAVNLPWAVDRVLARAATLPGADAPALLAGVRGEADDILDEDRRMCRAIGEHALPLLARDGEVRVLTHCNAGALATAGSARRSRPCTWPPSAGCR